MALNKRKGLKELLVERNKGLASKDTLGSQPLPTFSPLLPPAINLFAMANLKKERKEEVLEKGEVVLQKEPKQQKTTKG